MPAPRAILGLAAVAGIAVFPCIQGAAAQDATARLSDLKLSGDQPIQIDSDRLEVNQTTSMATFSGNVNVVQGPTLLKTGKMVVYYKNDGNTGSTPDTGAANIDKLEVSGNIYLKSGEQVATGDEGRFDMATNVLVLTGKEVVLSDPSGVLRGCKLTVDMKSSLATVESCGGPVKVTLTPGSKK